MVPRMCRPTSAQHNIHQMTALKIWIWACEFRQSYFCFGCWQAVSIRVPGYVPRSSDTGFKLEFLNFTITQKNDNFSEGSLKVSFLTLLLWVQYFVAQTVIFCNKIKLVMLLKFPGFLLTLDVAQNISVATSMILLGLEKAWNWSLFWFCYMLLQNDVKKDQIPDFHFIYISYRQSTNRQK